jgi:hypothetical protein
VVSFSIIGDGLRDSFQILKCLQLRFSSCTCGTSAPVSLSSPSPHGVVSIAS